MSHNATLAGKIHIQDPNTIIKSSKIMPDVVIRFPNKFTLGFIIVILAAIQLISFILFSIQIQELIDSSTEVEKKLTSMDQALNNHNDNFDVYLEKKSGKKSFFSSLHSRIDKFNQCYCHLFPR